MPIKNSEFPIEPATTATPRKELQTFRASTASRLQHFMDKFNCLLDWDMDADRGAEPPRAQNYP